jgi:hypothetical protein
MTILWFLIGWFIAALLVAYFVGGALRLGKADPTWKKRKNAP